MLQKQVQPERQKSKGNSSQFFVPQVLVLIFKYLSECKDVSARVRIISDLLDLLDSSPSNIEALMVHLICLCLAIYISLKTSNTLSTYVGVWMDCLVDSFNGA